MNGAVHHAICSQKGVLTHLSHEGHILLEVPKERDCSTHFLVCTCRSSVAVPF